MKNYWQYTMRKYGIITLCLVLFLLASSLIDVVSLLFSTLLIVFIIIRLCALKRIEYVRSKIDSTLVTSDKDAVEYFAMTWAAKSFGILSLLCIAICYFIDVFEFHWTAFTIYALPSILVVCIGSYVEWQNYRDYHKKQNIG